MSNYWIERAEGADIEVTDGMYVPAAPKPATEQVGGPFPSVLPKRHRLSWAARQWVKRGQA